ncbi:uncharacterized protein G2W53_011854 [Senna tora]|uniref:Uncharacterized protein n=1 Tax=Senna tora TaxID=362788 RepID=A0A834WRL6_9FABA|nr:uncharacterized protein G2W53_011854 [Senna tora]
MAGIVENLRVLRLPLAQPQMLNIGESLDNFN